MTTKVKKKKDYKLTKEQQKYIDELHLQRDLINEQLQRKWEYCGGVPAVDGVCETSEIVKR